MSFPRTLAAARCERCDSAMTFECFEEKLPQVLRCPCCAQRELDVQLLSVATQIRMIARYLRRPGERPAPRVAAGELEKIAHRLRTDSDR